MANEGHLGFVFGTMDAETYDSFVVSISICLLCEGSISS